MKKLLPIFIFLIAQAQGFSQTSKEDFRILEESPIRFERVSFKDQSLESVCAWLTTESKRIDPNKKGFVVRFDKKDLLDGDFRKQIEKKTLSIDLRDILLLDVLRAASSLSDVSFVIQGNEIIFIKNRNW